MDAIYVAALAYASLVFLIRAIEVSEDFLREAKELRQLHRDLFPERYEATPMSEGKAAMEELEAEVARLQRRVK